MSRQERVLERAEVEDRLRAELPRWSAGAGEIRRRYETQGWKSTVIVIAAIGHLSEAAWHHPEIAASYGWVEVRLSTHSAGGVTEKDLALAAKIEDVVAWRPGDEHGPLEGTPDDERFAHVKPD